MKKIIQSTFFAGALLLGISGFAQDRTSVDIQSIQTRTYDGMERDIFRAVLATLQNNKYEDIRSDSGAGLITARLPPVAAGDTPEQQTQKVVGSAVLGAIIPFGGFLVEQPKIGQKSRSVTVTVEQLNPQKTLVRVALKETEMLTQAGFFGSVKQETKENDMTDTPEAYQSIFEQIDKEIFIRSNR
jgi:hypothetical protein